MACSIVADRKSLTVWRESMPGVFISYRRDDTKGYAGALLRELNSRIGSDQVFMDIEDIEGGTDFPAVLRESVQSCDVLLALIGPHWLDARNAAGNRRLDDPRDFVRQEIALALNTNTTYLPGAILEKLRKFKKIHMNLSIDSVGDVYEYIRFPAKWEKINNNIKSTIIFQSILTYFMLSFTRLTQYVVIFFCKNCKQIFL